MAQKAEISYPNGVGISDLNKALEPLGARVVDEAQVTQPEVIEQLKQAWEEGRRIEREGPPKGVSEVLERAKEKGIDIFGPHYLPKLTLRQGLELSGWKVRPENWYWQQIKEGHVDKEAATLPGCWVLIDRTPKPNYQNGRQLYPNDPLGEILSQLRKVGEIPSFKNLPDTSRFRVSWDEIHEHVLPAIASILEVDSSHIRLPREIEFNVIGNLYYPEWGRTNTWEWFEDRFGGGRCLSGGSSDVGGLALASCDWSDDRRAYIGFRPLVVFSSKA